MSEGSGDSQNKPVTKPRAKRPPTGRPRGRPPKRDVLLVPSEMRRSLLAILDEPVEVRTASGPKTVATFEALLITLVSSALKGKPTALNHLMKLLIDALEQRERAHPQVALAEQLRMISEQPVSDAHVNYKMVRVQINFAKGKY